MKKHVDVQDPAGIQKCVLKCVGCCIDCFERFVRYLAKHAYIEIALTGENFITAAVAGYHLTHRNGPKFILMDGIGHVLIGLGELLVASLTGTATWFFINYYPPVHDMLYQPLIPVIFVTIFGYAVGHLFMTVFGKAANTLLHCFLLDRELNGSMNNPGNAHYAPVRLRNFV